jgi:acetyl-CoA carboxylase biotin carboxyl carrier protein
MDLNELKKLIKMIDESQVSEIEIEHEPVKTKGRFRIRISKYPTGTVMSHSTPVTQTAPMYYPAGTPSHGVQFESPETIQKSKTERPPDVVDMGNYLEVKSPIVGTFYRTPSPDAEPYTEVGSVVKPGQTLCIIEAMKIMNEIESEVTGKIAKILVENAQPVEYNQTLFLIEKL